MKGSETTATIERHEIDLLSSLLSGSFDRRLQLAARVLATPSSRRALARGDDAPLREAGLSGRESKRVRAGVELGRRVVLDVRAPVPETIETPEQAYLLMARELVGLHCEAFVVAVLDVKNRPQHICTVARGSVDTCLVDPREVFGPAVRERGSAVLIAHNHPSGNAEPSSEDLRLTERLAACAELLGIALLDHIIIGGHERYVSLAQKGLLPAAEQPASASAGQRTRVDPPSATKSCGGVARDGSMACGCPRSSTLPHRDSTQTQIERTISHHSRLWQARPPVDNAMRSNHDRVQVQPAVSPTE